MRFLLLNQTFYPDVMATGQYLTEVAVRLMERGHEVTVVTSRRAYDHPEKRFPKHEVWRGIQIWRIGSTGFGKTAKWRRAADFASFILCCCARLALLPRSDAVVALTSPPLISFIGAGFARLRGSRFYYWVMDFNPDEAIAAGWLRGDSFVAWVLERLSRFSLARSARIIALDRFMADRIIAKGVPAQKVAVIPPWSQDGAVRFDPAGRARFRQAHGLQNKFVVMYSGNHSPCHPLDTLLEAARRLAHEPRIVFCFVGGGSEFRRIQALVASPNTDARIQEMESSKHEPASGKPESEGRFPNPSTLNIPLSTTIRLPNILALPYQPLEQLAGSLSAADLHVVVMGDPFVGLVHPCKIYNILSVGAPILYIGPQLSHVSEILTATDRPDHCGQARHGDTDAVVGHILRLRRECQVRQPGPAEEPDGRFSRRQLLGRLVAELEFASPGPG